jgi:hypothetical protein
VEHIGLTSKGLIHESKKTKQHHVGIIAVTVDAPKLVQELIPRILRALLSVDSETPCIECEAQQRGMACITVASSFIAAITDDDMREKLIGELSGFVGEMVARARGEDELGCRVGGTRHEP